jgi:hypothetical protein
MTAICLNVSNAEGKERRRRKVGNPESTGNIGSLDDGHLAFAHREAQGNGLLCSAEIMI